MKNGKVTFRIRCIFFLLILLGEISSCNYPVKEVDLEGKWWFTFDVSKNIEGEIDCSFGHLAYVELFVYQKNEQFYLNYIYENGFKSINNEWLINPVAERGYYRISSLSNEICGFLEINKDGSIFLKENCLLSEKKVKFYPINKNFKHDYWHFFGNRKKWDEEFICRQTIHLKEVVMKIIN